MRIGELAAASGCSRRMLRYYEEQGLLHAERSANGYRVYGAHAAPRARNIRKLLAIGLTVPDVRAILPEVSGELPDTFDASRECAAGRGVALTRLEELDARLRTLEALRDQLRARLPGA